MKSAVTINKRDYDIYSFEIPFGVFFKRQAGKFISGILEKIHPFYSGLCCREIKIGFKHWKLWATVLVMEKIKLAEYRNSNNGKNLKVAEFGSNVFGESNVLRKIFAVMVCVLCGVWLFFGGKKEIEKVEVENAVTVATVMAPEKLLKKVFESVREEKGKIQFLSWKDGKCTFELEDCYPEKVFQGQYCSVSYQNGIPKFNLVLKSEARRKNFDSSEKPAEGRVAGEKIRKLLIEEGALPGEEKIQADRMEFKFKCTRRRFKELSHKLMAEARACDWGDDFLEINCTGGFVNVYVGLSAGRKKMDAEINKTPVEIVGEFVDLLKIQNLVEKVSVIPKKEMKRNAGDSFFKEKIGEFRTDSGSVRIFYKTKDGKTFWEDKKVSG